MMEIQAFANRPIDENCYVVSDSDTREAAIIDCGALWSEDQKAIGDYIREKGLHVVHHLLTHGHFDHLFGAQWVADTYGCLPKLHAADTDTYLNAKEFATHIFHRAIDFSIPSIGGYFDENDEITVGHLRLRVIHTPGHTPGGCCFYCEKVGKLLSGDSLFHGSIGRTDFPGGNTLALIDSLQKKVLTLPSSVTIYPGHGIETNVAQELLINHYLK